MQGADYLDLRGTVLSGFKWVGADGVCSERQKPPGDGESRAVRVACRGEAAKKPNNKTTYSAAQGMLGRERFIGDAPKTESAHSLFRGHEKRF